MEEEKISIDKPMARSRRRLWWLPRAAIVCVAALVLLVLSMPFIITIVPIPEIEFNLSSLLKGKLAEIAKSKTASIGLYIRRGDSSGFRIRAKGHLLDWPYTAIANVHFGLVRMDGNASLALDGTGWHLYADFAIAGKRDWRFNATISEHAISHDDQLLSGVLSRLAPSVASNLVFSGSFALDAEGSCTKERPVPAWSARAALKGVDASFKAKDGTSIETKNLRLRLGVDAIANHRDIAPMFPRADSVSAAGFVLSNAFASVRATERSYLVTEAGADCCGGELRLYSLFLDPEKLSAGATVFADGVDAGEVLSHVSGFHGQASGRLHGKLPFSLRNGRELHLKNAYLYSTPGETGKVRIEDSRPILDNLAMGGVSEDVRDNLSKALADLDYNILKVQLTRGNDGDDSSLAIKLEGSATHRETTVPVNIDVTFRGDLDQLVNTGMKLKR